MRADFQNKSDNEKVYTIYCYTLWVFASLFIFKMCLGMLCFIYIFGSHHIRTCNDNHIETAIDFMKSTVLIVCLKP